jgi:hypothetical protein
MRRQFFERARQVVELFTFKIPTRRRNRLGVGPYWDSIWPSCVYRATKDLKLDYVAINSHVCTKALADAQSIVAQAEVFYEADVENSLRMAAEIAGCSIESIHAGRTATSPKRRGAT